MYDEALKMTFADGSSIRMFFEASVEDCKNEADAMDAGDNSDAGSVWGRWIKSMYDEAIIGSLDSDV
jgi:hypothetical protein